MASEAIGQKLVVPWKINKGDLVRIRRRQSLDDNTEMTDEKIESHITTCMQNHYSWQPVQSYPN